MLRQLLLPVVKSRHVEYLCFHRVGLASETHLLTDRDQVLGPLDIPDYIGVPSFDRLPQIREHLIGVNLSFLLSLSRPVTCIGYRRLCRSSLETWPLRLLVKVLLQLPLQR